MDGGKLDIAVNATGLGLLACEETTEEELDAMMDLQFKGPYQFMQVLVLVMSNFPIIQTSLRRRRFLWATTTPTLVPLVSTTWCVAWLTNMAKGIRVKSITGLITTYGGPAFRDARVTRS